MSIDAIWVVVPAHNEEDAIVDTLKSIKDNYRNVVVVDDCSTDKTGVFARQSGADVCRHAVNVGQGAALATGIKYALMLGAQRIITFDADGQHDVGDTIRMNALMDECRVDVVLGSRFLGGTIDMPKGRERLLRLATLFTRLTTGLTLTDTHNGLRLLSRSAAEAIQIKHNKMAHASEILSQISLLKLSYAEAPCSIRYTEHSLRKGQKLSGAVTILFDLIIGALRR